jgi:hypothetical protein
MLLSFLYLIFVSLLKLLVGRGRPVLRVFVEHYNSECPHRALGRCPPAPTQLALPPPPGAVVERRDRLGGLVHEYYRAAA